MARKHSVIQDGQLACNIYNDNGSEPVSSEVNDKTLIVCNKSKIETHVIKCRTRNKLTDSRFEMFYP